jgi:8-oxo-dGTP pyrophosphatase MutT (NUDIX family)
MNTAPGKVVQLSHLRKLRQCEQVAGVCYRPGRAGIEFLLVRTRGGRWTFPKGGVEPGLTHAQAAALEAFEEAGVHGRMEEASFARYRSGRGVIHAHLCEVLRLAPPQERGRDRTWFTAEKAKRRLTAGRDAKEAFDICHVVDLARDRIRRPRDINPQFGEWKHDGLRRVQFEAAGAGEAQVALMSYLRREGVTRQVVPQNLRQGRLLQLTAAGADQATLPAKLR